MLRALVPWRPVLRRDLDIVARDRIATILSDLTPFDSNLGAVELCNRALVCAYADLYEASGPRCADIVEYLNAASGHVTDTLSSGITNGLSSIGWTFEHLRRLRGMSDDGDDPLEELEDLLLLRLGCAEWVGAYDLIGGLVGIGVFLLERLPLPAATDGLGLIVNHLERLAENTPSGTTWWTPPRLLPEHQQQESPHGHYDLGVAHGVPGVIAFLAECVAAGIQYDTANHLLDGSMRWLIAQQPSSQALSYGYWLADGARPRAPRIAWCYGDLGIAAVFHHVGARLDRPELTTFARSLLDRCVIQPADCLEPGLCHGAAGIAHSLSRIAQTDPDGRYLEAANRYYERALVLLDGRRSEVGMTQAGAAVPTVNPATALAPSFLDGTIGIALALISAVEPIEPQWDRRLLVSGRSRFDRRH